MTKYVVVAALLAVSGSLVGCGKSVPTGTYVNASGELIEVREVGESYALDVWKHSELFEPGPHMTAPLRVDEEGNLLATIGLTPLKFVPTENGLALFSGSSQTEYVPIDLAGLSEPGDASERVEQALEYEIERQLIAPVRESERLFCGALDRGIDRKHMPHLIEAVDAAKIEDLEITRRVEQTAAVYEVEGVLRIPAHTSVREGKKCVKRKSTLFGRRCVKRSKANFEVTSPAFELPIVARAAMPRKLAPKSSERLVLDLQAVGKIQMSSLVSPQLCREYIRPDNKSVIQEAEVKAAH